MHSGFVITPMGETALELFDTIPGVRYAARLEDGQGFMAYDVDGLAEVLMLGQYGQVFNELPPEQQGDADELLRRLGSPKGPKRQSADGNERFILYAVPEHTYSAEDWLDIINESHPKGACIVTTYKYPELVLYVLVEVGLEWEGDFPNAHSVLDSAAVEYRDIRLLHAV
jgi:hypothetical protein